MQSDSILLAVASNSLEHILQTLADSPEILASPTLAAKLGNALFFCREAKHLHEKVIVQLEDLETAYYTAHR